MSIRPSEDQDFRGGAAMRSGLDDEIEVVRRELIDLAFVLEAQGRVDAADLANAVVVRLAGLSSSARRERIG